jgi:cyclophilin family peptidyl-prolyl cis-trans isomerase
VNERWWNKTCAILLAGIMLSLAGCGKAPSNTNANFEANIKKGVKPVPDGEVAVFELENPAYGRIVMELYPNLAPKMVERFKQLIREGFYNGTTFHRIDPDLGIIQGGDPLSKDDNPNNDGGGDSPYPDVPSEFSDVPYERGIVGAARQGANDDPRRGPIQSEEEARETANCQFYITLKRVQGFDGNYTVFGRVIEGMNNADVIAGAPTTPGTPRPADKIIIKSATLKPR